MAWFVVQCTDGENVLAARQQARPAHLARLQVLADAGRVLAAGPLPRDPDDLSQGFHGSVLILEFADQQALQDWLADEPYLHAGVYREVSVKPFLKVFPQD